MIKCYKIINVNMKKTKMHVDKSKLMSDCVG